LWLDTNITQFQKKQRIKTGISRSFRKTTQ
jgi:hypothetical protein